MLRLDSIIRGTDNTEAINNLEFELIYASDPMPFSGAESVEISHDKDFNNACLFLSSNLNIKPKELTVFEFYNAFEHIKETQKNK